jgi:hypothetical protein
MWVIYDHPSDYPQGFVARLWLITPECEQRTETLRQEGNLAAMREGFLRDGLSCLARHPEDDPVIVETWL